MSMNRPNVIHSKRYLNQQKADLVYCQRLLAHLLPILQKEMASETKRVLRRYGRRHPMNRHVLSDAAKATYIGNSDLFDIVQDMLAEGHVLRTAVAESLKRLAKDAENVEALCLMPPVRRERRVAKRKPATLVGKRAATAAERLAQWKRKRKLAETKIRKYQTKVNYYKKKGNVDE